LQKQAILSINGHKQNSHEHEIEKMGMDHTLLRKSPGCGSPVKTTSCRGFSLKLNNCFVIIILNCGRVGNTSGIFCGMHYAISCAIFGG